jgi:hypothetical protein
MALTAAAKEVTFLTEWTDEVHSHYYGALALARNPVPLQGQNISAFVILESLADKSVWLHISPQRIRQQRSSRKLWGV